MSKSNNLTDYLTDLGASIKNKAGITTPLNAQNFSTVVDGFELLNGETRVETQSVKTATYTPTPPKNGITSIEVSVNDAVIIAHAGLAVDGGTSEYFDPGTAADHDMDVSAKYQVTTAGYSPTTGHTGDSHLYYKIKKGTFKDYGSTPASWDDLTPGFYKLSSGFFGSNSYYQVRYASNYNFSIADKSNDVTIGTKSGSSYPLMNSLTGTLTASTEGWFKNNTSSASNVKVGMMPEAQYEVSGNIVKTKTTGAGYTPAEKIVGTIAAGAIKVNNLTITPNALKGVWDTTNEIFKVSQAGTTATMQSAVDTAGYMSSDLGTKGTGTATVSAPSVFEIPQATFATEGQDGKSLTGGYIPAGKTVSHVATGSATTPATTIKKNPTLSTSYTANKGYLLSVSATESVTPTIVTGYISSGTAGTITVQNEDTPAYVPQASVALDLEGYLSSGTISSGKQIKINAGYYPVVRYYTAEKIDFSGDATAWDVLESKTFYSSDSTKRTGVMPDRGVVTETIDYGETYTIPRGFHHGTGTVTTNIPDVIYSSQVATADTGGIPLVTTNGYAITKKLTNISIGPDDTFNLIDNSGSITELNNNTSGVLNILKNDGTIELTRNITTRRGNVNFNSLYLINNGCSSGLTVSTAGYKATLTGEVYLRSNASSRLYYNISGESGNNLDVLGTTYGSPIKTISSGSTINIFVKNNYSSTTTLQFNSQASPTSQINAIIPAYGFAIMTISYNNPKMYYSISVNNADIF